MKTEIRFHRASGIGGAPAGLRLPAAMRSFCRPSSPPRAIVGRAHASCGSPSLPKDLPVKTARPIRLDLGRRSAQRSGNLWTNCPGCDQQREGRHRDWQLRARHGGLTAVCGLRRHGGRERGLRPGSCRPAALWRVNALARPGRRDRAPVVGGTGTAASPHGDHPPGHVPDHGPGRRKAEVVGPWIHPAEQ